MQILLPPSEGKATEGDGPVLDLSALSHAALTPTRRKVLSALLRVSRGAQKTALDVLGLTEGQREAVLRNREIKKAPTLRACDLYTGVLYDNLRLNELDERARAKVLIFSGLWGVLTPDDRVPPYRLAMGVSLPPLGGLAATWRPVLTRALRPEGMVVDMRSAPYAAAWKQRPSAPSPWLRPTAPVVGVRVSASVVNGQVSRSVVSHMAKATRAP